MVLELLLALLSLLVAFIGVCVGFIGAFIFSELKRRIRGAVLFILGVGIWFVSSEIML